MKYKNILIILFFVLMICCTVLESTEVVPSTTIVSDTSSTTIISDTPSAPRDDCSNKSTPHKCHYIAVEWDKPQNRLLGN